MNGSTITLPGQTETQTETLTVPWKEFLGANVAGVRRVKKVRGEHARNFDRELAKLRRLPLKRVYAKTPGAVFICVVCRKPTTDVRTVLAWDVPVHKEHGPMRADVTMLGRVSFTEDPVAAALAQMGVTS